MVKLVVKQPGFFVSIPSVGTFRSPFKIKIPESLESVVRATLLKEGIKDYELGKTKKDLVSKKKEPILEPKEEIKESVDLSSVMKRLDDIQSLVQQVLRKKTPVEKIIIKGEPRVREVESGDIEEDIFIPTISKEKGKIDLSVKTSDKDDVSSRVDTLLNLKERG